jgi:hypothetical protein
VEERGTYDDVPGQVDAVRHGGDLLEGVQHGAVRAAHGAAVLVLGVAKLVEAGGAGALGRPQAEQRYCEEAPGTREPRDPSSDPLFGSYCPFIMKGHCS